MPVARGLLLALTIALGAVGELPARAVSAETAQALRTVPLVIVSDRHRHRHRFTVEVARTPPEQARGLMFRTRLGPDRGMIFPTEPARFVSFWMKNTLIPLDMVFIRGDGTIANIAARTVPHSLAPVSSDEPVAAVLEIAGGRAAQLGIKPGDRVRWTAQ